MDPKTAVVKVKIKPATKVAKQLTNEENFFIFAEKNL